MTVDPYEYPKPSRVLSDDDVDAIVNRFVERLTDRKTVDAITDAWSGSIDRSIGRGLRRLAGAVVIALVLLAAVKLDALPKMFGKSGLP